MKTRKELQAFYDKACRMIAALQEVPSLLGQNNRATIMEFRFKPVFYVRSDMMNDLLALTLGWLSHTPVKETEILQGAVMQHVPKLCGIELYCTNRHDAPEIALALEPDEKA